MTDTGQSTRRTFAEVSRVRPVGPGRFEAQVDPEWTIMGKPNGGYLAAMLARAATSSRDHDHVIAFSAHYLRSPDPGPVRIVTEDLRAGRSASQVRARMEQGGQACVEALVTASRLDGGSEPYWDHGVPERSHASFEDCTPLVPVTPEGARVALMDQIEVYLDPQTAGFTRAEPAGRAELRGWLALPGGEAFDPSSLLFAVDSFPPATFDIARSGWVPTLELTAYVRALPAPGRLEILQRAHLVEARRVDEACFVWDSDGRLVAQGTQLAAVRLG